MQEGWIKLHRVIRENWIWEDPKKLKWWLDILLQANHQERKILINNELITIKRGSFFTSILKLSERWKADRKAVKRFLDLLQDDDMISFKTSKNGTTIEISNYNTFQDFSSSDMDNRRDNGKDNRENNGRDNGEDNRKDTRRDTNNNEKNYNNDNNEKNERKDSPQLPPLSFPTSIHKAIFDNFTEVTYRTWFTLTEIKEDSSGIIVRAPNEFTKNIINSKYKDKLETLLNKKVDVVIE